MDFIMLWRSRTVDGLSAMMDAAIDGEKLVATYVDLSVALLIVEIAKRAPDKEEWFPKGKWATIQSIQGKIEEQLDAIRFPVS